MKTSRALLLLALLATAGVGAAWWTGRLPFGAKPTTTGDGQLPPGPLGGAAPGGRRAQMSRNDGPVPVLVAPVGRADVDLHVEGIGTAQADATVTVKAQVDGRLTEVRFSEGQEVAAGDVLAVIDPASYKAVWDQAVAKRDQDLADLANARADLERYERLAKSEAGSRQQADSQRATVAKLEAQTRIDAGAIDAARINLDYTTIRAPIAGRTGLRSIDVGNLVKASDTTGLVTIARIRPIAVTFTVAQQRLPELLAAEKRGPIPVEVLGSDRKTVVERGEVTVIDNQVDASTGTVKLKARLPNRDEALWPGQFVDLRIAVDRLKNVRVVPSAAVQRTAEGPWVYVVDGEGKARRRAVTITRQDETRAVIDGGLEDGEKVVTTGFARLTDGAAVRADDAAAAAAGEAGPAKADTASSDRPRRKSGQGRPDATAAPGAPATAGTDGSKP
ncbi:MAG: efflux RND transporter periplasmic adaptor subunit [Hyphomicrobiales bacterium]|nr:efflux RND transporter periplasmic adaptor subunit [Hyphomicrobiales bacterium]